jgi:hypothetical protein
VVLRMNSGSTTRQAVGVVGICDCGLPGFVAVTPNALLFPPLLACLLACLLLLACWLTDVAGWSLIGSAACRVRVRSGRLLLALRACYGRVSAHLNGVKCGC